MGKYIKTQHPEQKHIFSYQHSLCMCEFPKKKPKLMH
uniref:Uncharacterized protein n=1 Tax=Rhizophora mucronata TaxID=61149 RepID=A0A2P2MZV2_RHIMU